MSRRALAVIVLITALALAAPLMAGQGKGNAKGKEKDKGNPHAQSFDDRGRGDEHGRGDRDDDRWERRGNYDVRIFARNARPPGWSEGRKTGWRDCDLPPGQAKKYGCRTYVYEGRRYYYYRDEYDRIIVRRPSLHVSVDIVR